MEQDILIYIDDKERLDASAAANSFAHKDVKNRAYINTLGAELAMKYLVSENIDVSTAKNIHSIKKILEETDIADIILPNIHIDVRVVFDENAIFIPKSHFEYNLTPDIYLVFNLSQNREFVKFLGFFEPKLINKNNANSEYYFIEKEKLSPALDLINYINSHNGSTNRELSDEDIENSERFIVSMSDNDISETDKKHLIKQLIKSAELRDKFIEYENFETLSYKAMNDPMIEKKEVSKSIEETFEPLEEISFDENIIDTLPIEEPLIPEEEQAKEQSVLEDTIEEEEGEDVQQPITDGIDFEALEIPETLETFEEPVIDAISFDGIELPTEEEQQPVLEDTIEEEIPQPITDGIDFEALEIPETLETFEEPVIDAISFDGIELSAQEETTEEPIIEAISLDAIELPEEQVIVEPVADLLSFDKIEPLQTEDSESSEEQLTVEEMNFETEDSAENIAEIPDIIEPTDIFEQTIEEPPVIEDIIESLPFETTDEPVETEESSFGKNLLENLSAENDDIAIESTEDYISSDDNISSSDLLSQIDDVLSSSSTADIPMDEDLMPTDSIDDILNETEDLNVLYNEETTAEEQPAMPEPEVEEQPLPQVPGSALYNNKKSDKKSLITAGALIAVLAAASAFYFLKPKDNTADIEPLQVNNQAPALPQQTTSDDILASNTPTPQVPEKKEVEAPKTVVKELKNNPPKPVKSESYMDVSRLVWDVPDALSYSTKMQSYLRTAGRSIKLSLSADLLLATEYAYTNQVKVGLTLSKNGAIQDARILSGSGSTQIDNIVLQSVKDTLNVVKPPADEIKTPDFNLNLIIYF